MASLRECLTAVVSDWEDHVLLRKPAFDRNVLNSFIQQHEDVLVAYGKMVDGIRVLDGEYLEPHQTFNGVLGIVSLSVRVLKIKANRVC